MIVTYLARLILILPELSHADASHLQDIIDLQNPLESGARLRDLSAIVTADKPVEGARPSDRFVNRKIVHQTEKNQRIDKSQLHGKENAPCVHVNETMRKYLVQVR